MAYLPIFIELTGRSCVVIGGGAVAERKVQALRAAGAIVTVVSPAVGAGLAALADAGAITRLAREYRPGDLAGMALAFAATGDLAAERAIAAEAAAAGIPINVADVPELCSFIAPAVMRRGGLQIAIATGGASPALAGVIRAELEDRYGPEYELTIELMAAARRWLRVTLGDAGERGPRLIALARSGLRDALRRGDFDLANDAMRGAVGAGLAELGYDRIRCEAALRELGVAIAGGAGSARGSGPGASARGSGR